MSEAEAVERILLVGFMGAGKSTVGGLLAEALGWRFIDADAWVEAAEGRTISEIFRTDGEGHFRVLEDRAMLSILTERRVVVATGGGWSALAGRLSELPAGTATVWLKVSPGEAVRRSRGQRTERPLLEVDPLESARQLLGNRVEHYASAQTEVDTEGRTPEDVSALILETLRERWPELGTEQDG